MEQIKVLIIDPDDANRAFLAQILLKKNCLVLHAKKGQEGLEAAANAQPNVIVVETNLADLSPTEFMNRMETNPLLTSIPAWH